ncbi:uncharacterized protein BYT42DRAFT_553897 [Radiomyces spectabilis]|uniref:uncharacterized protein n=1 Tax=Radiomyces spectabilis TaxID=64574 RepID=UPI00221F625D|nr:uncharacterized protein BYT42DRAFT_553897 [Radiomyces spectabilis]KAI8394262.1 hypothetical protein BYT42DRAFT_553897 [Radiomyces spectabilis]
MRNKRYQNYFKQDGRIYTCSICHSQLLRHDDIVSRAFQGRHGPAYLVDHVINIYIGAKEERMLMTGMHTVADIYCSICEMKLGWKYLHAFEESQKYKEGRCIVEKARISKEVVFDF